MNHVVNPRHKTPLAQPDTTLKAQDRDTMRALQIVPLIASIWLYVTSTRQSEQLYTYHK